MNVARGYYAVVNRLLLAVFAVGDGRPSRPYGAQYVVKILSLYLLAFFR